jgi:hypothetical protein
MKSCKEISILTERSSFEKISLKDKMGLWMHKMMCSFCKNYSKESRTINKALKNQVNLTTELSSLEKKQIQQGLTK